MVLNGCLFNSEVWSGYSQQDLHDLEVIYHKVFRFIIGAKAKVLSEMLYQERTNQQKKIGAAG